MAYEFLPYDLDQTQLLPPNPRDWLPEGHLALCLADVLETLDLRPLLQAYRRGRGPRGYHPRMLLAVLLYGYCIGVFSSRRLAARCETDIAFRVLSGGQLPDFRKLSDFRLRHLGAMNALFLAVLQLCREAGLLMVGHLSLDGSKYQANASKHKEMSYGRIQETEPVLPGGGERGLSLVAGPSPPWSAVGPQAPSDSSFPADVDTPSAGRPVTNRRTDP